MLGLLMAYEDKVTPSSAPRKFFLQISGVETLNRWLLIERELVPARRLNSLLDETNQLTAIVVASRKTAEEDMGIFDF
jgi:hypothetical protein